MYQPQSMDKGQPAFAIELADVARHNRPLAIYAGAGVSQASPTDIPVGAEIAQRCHARIIELLRDVLDCDDPSNLTLVADAVARNGSLRLMQRTAVGVANFTTARPNFSHEVLALLLLEGVVIIVTTNWDDCIERAMENERVLAVISDQDRQQIQAPAILKVHGCATRPTTVLITTDDLAEPPAWARAEVNVRLSQSHTVFIGIGDVSGHIGARIREARDSIGDAGTIYVVSPNIQTEWDRGHWAEILPDLPDNQRIPITSDEFLDHLAAACVRGALREIFEAVNDETAAAEAFNKTRRAFDEGTSIEALRWLRNCSIPQSPGVSVTQHQAFSQALIALGRMAEDGAVALLAPGRARAADVECEVLAAVGTVTASTFRREATARLVRYRSDQGAVTPLPTFLISGALGRLDRVQALPADVLDASDARDLVTGPLAVEPNFIHAEDYIT